MLMLAFSFTACSSDDDDSSSKKFERDKDDEDDDDEDEDEDDKKRMIRSLPSTSAMENYLKIFLISSSVLMARFMHSPCGMKNLKIWVGTTKEILI